MGDNNIKALVTPQKGYSRAEKKHFTTPEAGADIRYPEVYGKPETYEERYMRHISDYLNVSSSLEKPKPKEVAARMKRSREAAKALERAKQGGNQGGDQGGNQEGNRGSNQGGHQGGSQESTLENTQEIPINRGDGDGEASLDLTQGVGGPIFESTLLDSSNWSVAGSSTCDMSGVDEFIDADPNQGNAEDQRKE